MTDIPPDVIAVASYLYALLKDNPNLEEININLDAHPGTVDVRVPFAWPAYRLTVTRVDDTVPNLFAHLEDHQNER